jgi:hypothetical protein
MTCDWKTDIKESEYPASGIVARPTLDLSILQVGFHRHDYILNIETLRSKGYQTVQEMYDDWYGFLHRTFECTLVG